MPYSPVFSVGLWGIACSAGRDLFKPVVRGIPDDPMPIPYRPSTMTDFVNYQKSISWLK